MNTCINTAFSLKRLAFLAPIAALCLNVLPANKALAFRRVTKVSVGNSTHLENFDSPKNNIGYYFNFNAENLSGVQDDFTLSQLGHGPLDGKYSIYLTSLGIDLIPDGLLNGFENNLLSTIGGDIDFDISDPNKWSISQVPFQIHGVNWDLDIDLHIGHGSFQEIEITRTGFVNGSLTIEKLTDSYITKTPTVAKTPEPSSIFTLLTLGGLGAAFKLKNQAKKG